MKSNLAAIGDLAPAARPWQILVVDDDDGVLAVTRLTLRDLKFDGRPMALHCVTSAAAAREAMTRIPDMDVILLDVVMESETAGIEFADWVRDTLGNATARIIIRTGQPGTISPLELLAQHQIDGYCAKSDLSSIDLKLTVLGSLRTVRLIRQLQAAAPPGSDRGSDPAAPA